MNPTRKVIRFLCAPFTPNGRRFLEQRTGKSWEGLYLLLLFLYRVTFARHQRVIIVIGSLGKTTATRALLHAFHLPEGRVIENPNYGSSLAFTFMGIPLRQKTVVLEVGIAYPGQMRRMTCPLRPDGIVFTCVATEHIFSFRDKAHIAEEKATAIEALRPGGHVVINGDDPLVCEAVGRYPVKVTRFGFEQSNDCRGLDWTLDWPKGSRLRLRVGCREHEIDNELLSRDSSYALLGAWAMARRCGQSDEVTLNGLSGFTATPGRLQRVRAASGAWILRDDFKSTYETIHLALDVLDQLPGRRIVVIGGIEAAPNPQKVAYESIARHLGGVADEIVVVHGDWRNLYKAELNRQVAGAARLSKVTVVRSHAEAIAALRGTLGLNDVVLVKGRVRERLGVVADGLIG